LVTILTYPTRAGRGDAGAAGGRRRLHRHGLAGRRQVQGNWAKLFGFKIKGNEVVIGNEDTDAFIDELDKQFSSWNAKEIAKDGKR